MLRMTKKIEGLNINRSIRNRTIESAKVGPKTKREKRVSLVCGGTYKVSRKGTSYTTSLIQAYSSIYIQLGEGNEDRREMRTGKLR